MHNAILSVIPRGWIWDLEGWIDSHPEAASGLSILSLLALGYYHLRHKRRRRRRSS